MWFDTPLFDWALRACFLAFVGAAVFLMVTVPTALLWLPARYEALAAFLWDRAFDVMLVSGCAIGAAAAAIAVTRSLS